MGREVPSEGYYKQLNLLNRKTLKCGTKYNNVFDFKLIYR